MTDVPANAGTVNTIMAEVEKKCNAELKAM